MASPRTPEKWRLWHPSNGIAFTPAARSPQHGRLEMARFFHGSLPDLTGDQAPPEADSKATALSQSSRRDSAPPSLDPANEQSPGDAGIATEAAVAEVNADMTAKDEEEAETEEEDEPLGPPVSNLSFKMTDDALRAAQLATPGNPEAFWSYTMYRGPAEDGTEGPKVTVHYCRSEATTEKVCQYFLDEPVLGFDLEWFPQALKFEGARRNVSLVQLASPTRIALFHLALYPKADSLVAPSLRKIMEDNNITKTGVWIRGDCTRLRNFLGIHAAGIFELSHLYKLVKHSAPGGDTSLINKKLVPLATQVHEHLHLPMFKGQDVRSSDWSKMLRLEQIIYSASDAYAAVQLYDVMNVKREALDPTPPLPHHAEKELPIGLAEVVAEEEEGEEDAAEQAEGEGEDRATLTLSSSYLSSATEELEMEPEPSDDAAQDTTAASDPAPVPAPKPARKAAAPKAPPKPKDARIVAAESWVASYRANDPPPAARVRACVGPASLRAYYIWHTHTDMDPVALAALLRDPPLQTMTVVSYILEAIKVEKLPYAKERLGREVFGLLDGDLSGRKGYGKLREACKAWIGTEKKEQGIEKDEEARN